MHPCPIIDHERWRQVPLARRSPAGDAEQRRARGSVDSLETVELDGRGVAHDALDCRSVIRLATMSYLAFDKLR
jgi:hypothetical protein